MPERLLITGATGFVGRALTRGLLARGLELRLLVRPSRRIRGLPRSGVEVAVASLRDPRALRAALTGTSTVIHLASAEGDRRRRNLLATDIEGTAQLLEQARLAGVKRLLYLSHLGAERNSAFPFLQAKGIVEQMLLESGMPALILRTSVIFGPEDAFTNVIALAASAMPLIFPVPDSRALLQPLWIDDLVACVDLALRQGTGFGQILSLGGPEHLSFEEIVAAVLAVTRKRRWLVRVWPPYLRWGAWWLDHLFPFSPYTPFWSDYLAVNRTCEANSLARLFGIRAAKIGDRLDYLRRGRGLRGLIRFLSQGPLIFAEG